MPPRLTAVSATNPNGAKNSAPTDSILSRIAPIRENNFDQLTCSFYGSPGTGKTRLACTFPKPLLLIAAEVGTDSVVGCKGVDVAPLEKTEEIWQLLELAATGRSTWGENKGQWRHLGAGNFSGEPYRTVVLDTATKLRAVRIKEAFAARGKPEVPRSQPFMYADKEWKDVWNQTSQDMKKMLSELLDLSRTAQISVVVNSHEANLTHDDGNTASEFLRPNIASAIGKSVSEFLNAECSYVGQMLIREKTVQEVVKIGELSSTVNKKVGAEYVMRVGPDAVYRTKFRRPLSVTTPLPDFIVDPSYEKIVRVIKGEPV